MNDGGGTAWRGGGLLYRVSLRAQEKQEAQEARRSLSCLAQPHFTALLWSALRTSVCVQKTL